VVSISINERFENARHHIIICINSIYFLASIVEAAVHFLGIVRGRGVIVRRQLAAVARDGSSPSSRNPASLTCLIMAKMPIRQ
jgi:hypothetical protein